MFGARVPGGVFDWAYGWRAQKSPRGTNIIWASGLMPEFSAMFQKYVDEDVTIIFLTNNSLNGYPFRDVLVVPGREAAIERIVFGKDYTLPPWFIETDSNSLSAYAGTYKTVSGEEFVVTADKNALRVAPRSQRRRFDDPTAGYGNSSAGLFHLSRKSGKRLINLSNRQQTKS